MSRPLWSLSGLASRILTGIGAVSHEVTAFIEFDTFYRVMPNFLLLLLSLLLLTQS